MNTYFGPTFGPDYTGRPARMPSTEQLIWLRWRDDALRGASKLWFDVGLGPGLTVPEDADPNIRKMWIRNTQRRADVIIEYNTHVLIVEVRHFASPNVVGRLLTYRRLWIEDDPIPGKRVDLMVVTNFHDNDTDILCGDLGIRYLVI